MWSRFLERMRVVRLVASFDACGEGPAPEALTCALRGAFGRALHARDSEAYEALFVSPRPARARAMRLYPFVPHPYVLHAAHEGQDADWLAVGDRVHLTVTLFGSAAERWPSVDAALDAIEALGPGRVAMARVARTEDVRVCSLAETVTREAVGAVDDVAHSAADDYALTTVTPLRVVHGGVVTRTLPLDAMVRSLLARASALAEFYEPEAALAIDFAAVVAQARAAREVESRLAYRERRRRSTRTGARQSLGGVEGQVRWTGVSRTLRPLLAAGELIHVGKATTFGLGRYQAARLAGGAL